MLALNRLRHSFRNSSLRNKLTAIIMLTSAIVLLGASLAFVSNEFFIFRRNVALDLRAMAELVGINSTAGLLFQDARIARENMSALKAKPNIQCAHIFGKDGLLFASYFRHEKVPADFKPGLTVGDLYFIQRKPEVTGLAVSDQVFWEENRVEVFQHIYFQKEILGTVYISADLTELHNRLTWAAGITLAVMLLSMLLAFLLASRLQRLVTAPVFHLLDIMRQVSTEKNYQVRAHKNSDDELGTLIDGFNHMLGQIHDNNQELKDYRQHLEEKVEQRTVELAEARDQALAASKAKSIFLANMSHEIRTPMNAVLGYTQILRRDTELTAVQRNALKTIESSGNHLLGLIHDILDISKIEAGAVELRLEHFCLSALLEEISALFQLRCTQKKLHWQVQNQVAIPQPIYADQGKLRQILINLLGNAVKFTDNGSVTLSVERLTTPADGAQALYRFTVCDTGPGIAPAAQRSIFEPFQQEQAGLDKGGTGLGLAITRRQIELMQGRISVHSELGKGACFAVELPLQAGDRSQFPHAPAPILGKMRLRAGQSLHALVVDDIEENRSLLAHLLGDLGIQVALADSGAAALAMLRQQLPEVVFSDIRMPGMDGVELIQAIQAQWVTAMPVCIAISASPLRQQNQEVLDAGYQAFISKPFYFEAVYEALRQHLQVEFEPVLAADEQPVVAAEIDFTTLKLPPALYQQLLEAAEFNELTELEQLLVQLRSGEPAWQQFAEHCQQRLDQYDSSGIIALLESLADAQ